MSVLTSQVNKESNIPSQLQGRLPDNASSLDWLVVAHCDPSVIARLSHLLDENTAAILQIPQQDWSLESDSMREAIAWSIKEKQVKHLLFIGHSECDFPADADNDPAKFTSRYDRLLAEARDTYFQTRNSKAHFSDQIAAVLDQAEVKEAKEGDTLKLHALFYMAPSGTFLMFDPESQTFEPIVA